jgi:hypothetical protein
MDELYPTATIQKYELKIGSIMEQIGELKLIVIIPALL